MKTSADLFDDIFTPRKDYSKGGSKGGDFEGPLKEKPLSTLEERENLGRGLAAGATQLPNQAALALVKKVAPNSDFVANARTWRDENKGNAETTEGSIGQFMGGLLSPEGALPLGKVAGAAGAILVPLNSAVLKRAKSGV